MRAGGSQSRLVPRLVRQAYWVSRDQFDPCFTDRGKGIDASIVAASVSGEVFLWLVWVS